MTTETKTKKVSDTKEDELEQKIMHTVAKSLFSLASEIGKLRGEISDLTENKAHPH
jgi:transposase